MHMDYLWFDVAIHGEPHPDEDLIVRLDLSDGAESGPEAAKPAVPDPQPTAAVDPF